MQLIGKKVLLSEDQLKQKTTELGQKISADFEGKELIVVGILKGAMIFMADLVRKITIPTYYDFIAVSSYGSSTTSSGTVRLLKDLDQDIGNRHILIVEDIVDTGLTLNYLLENLHSRNPASITLCALLDKPSKRIKPVDIHYCGFSIPDVFVVGYGLDYNEKYRNLPYVAILDPENL
ncbi:MAG: hypoxanthine phosphoribosyltransferase [Peptococcaceae bacterium]|nr:hypoxanthine phosphoribosyltransferase [Peptococcaceae bacterium]